MATSSVSKHDTGLLAGFHSAWSLVQHGSAHHIRIHLANLKTAREVCSHLVVELDQLIKLAEERLAEHEAIEQGIRDFEKNISGLSRSPR